MKKTKINPHDVLYFSLAVILALCIFLHVTSSERAYDSYDTVLLVRLYKSKGEPSEEKNVLIDGRIGATVLFSNPTYAVLLCHGKMKRGVFFADGAKTVCENQPLCFYGESCGGEGRIDRILFTKLSKI